MGTTRDTYVNWETGKTEPVAAQFRPVVEFLGYNPTPTPTRGALGSQAPGAGHHLRTGGQIPWMGPGHPSTIFKWDMAYAA
jgi:hypothetical protein